MKPVSKENLHQRNRWAQPGKRQTLLRLRDYIRQNVIGPFARMVADSSV
jgi:hypothetical protein